MLGNACGGLAAGMALLDPSCDEEEAIGVADEEEDDGGEEDGAATVGRERSGCFTI